MPSSGAVVDRLLPAVRDFARPPFRLRVDLERLLRVWAQEAAEAVILYAARMLDALAAEALERAQLPATKNVFLNLNALQHYHLIPATTHHWAHALRRLGNDARHLRRPIGPGDAELAATLCEQVLDWFFCRYRAGDHLPALTADGAPVFPVPPALRADIAAFDHPGFHPRALLTALAARPPAAPHAPALLARLAESLHEHDAPSEALSVLELGLSACPDDVRLRQLMGVHWSRQGDTAAALAWLEPLYANADLYKDEETAGIIAGVYKRAWRANRAETKWLSHSFRAYLDAWTAYSAQLNAYLGVNAAATALLLGRRATARRIAGTVWESLQHRQRVLGDAGPDLLTFWDRVTAAEAQLLLGELAGARRAYADAFTRFPAVHGQREVSREQAEELLSALGVLCTFAAWLALPTAEAPPVRAVGVTGHRALPDDPALAAAVADTLAHIRREGGAGGWRC